MARRTGSIERRGTNVWRIRWYAGQDKQTDKRLYPSRTIHGTRRDAEQALRHALGQKDEGIVHEPRPGRVEELLDDWMASLRGKRAKATIDGYDDILRLYVRPVLGHLRLEDLKLGHVEDDLVGDMQARGKSPRTIRLAVTALGAACKWGMRRGRLARNPCEGAQLPKDRGTRKRGSLTQEQVKALRQAAADSPMAALFDFLLFTGVRPGEAFALRWKDLDLRKNTAHIAQTISRHKGGWEFLPPKAGSERKVPLPQTLVRALRTHRKARAEHRLQLGNYYNAEHDLVFANDVGEPLDERNVSQRWLKPAVEAAGLPKEVSLYWLRHSHATNLLAAGVPVKDVSHRLGHNSAKMTLDVYAHALPGRDEHVAEVVEGLFGD